MSESLDNDASPKNRLNKLKETQEQRRKQQMHSRMQVLLFRHKELLKKDILKRRALLEKELQIDVQVSIFLKLLLIVFVVFILINVFNIVYSICRKTYRQNLLVERKRKDISRMKSKWEAQNVKLMHSQHNKLVHQIKIDQRNKRAKDKHQL